MLLFVAIAVFIFHNKNVNTLLLAELFALIFVSAPILMRIFKEIGYRVSFFQKNDIKKEIRLGFPVVLTNIVDFVLNGSDKFIIALLLSTRAVGYYSPAYALGSIIILIPKVSGGGLLLPLLAKITDNNEHHNSGKLLIHYTIKLFLLIAIPFVCGSFVLSRRLLEFFANKEVADSAFLVTPIVALGTVFYGLNIILSSVLFVKLRTKIVFIINALSAVLNLALNFIFIYLFRNILIAAITTLLCYFISFILLNRSIMNDVEIDYDLRVILKFVLGALMMSAAMHYLLLYQKPDIFGFIFSLLAGTILYFICLFILRAISPKELSFVRKYLTSLFIP
jgi:O-antigen/teichoic acid export membrane protein